MQTIKFKVGLRFLALVLLLGLTPKLFAKRPLTQDLSKINWDRLVFYDCKDQCMAKKNIAALKPFRLTSEDNAKPFAIRICHEKLGGSFGLHRLIAQERGVCTFRDGSKVELQALQEQLKRLELP